MSYQMFIKQSGMYRSHGAALEPVHHYIRFVTGRMILSQTGGLTEFRKGSCWSDSLKQHHRWRVDIPSVEKSERVGLTRGWGYSVIFW